MNANIAQDAHDHLLKLMQSLPLDEALNLSIDNCLAQIASQFAVRHSTGLTVTSQSLRGQLTRQKALTAQVEAQLREEFPQRDGNRIASLWHLRVAFAPPNIPARPVSESLRQFPSNWTEAASTSMAACAMTQARDAFCKLIKMFNKQNI